MKLDKYGDRIITEKQPLPKIPKLAFALLSLVQAGMITVNILVLILEFLNFYVAFATVPLYVFSYIHFSNGYNTNFDEFIIPKYIKVVRILSPIIYIITSIPAVFQVF